MGSGTPIMEEVALLTSSLLDPMRHALPPTAKVHCVSLQGDSGEQPRLQDQPNASSGQCTPQGTEATSLVERQEQRGIGGAFTSPQVEYFEPNPPDCKSHAAHNSHRCAAPP